MTAVKTLESAPQADDDEQEETELDALIRSEMEAFATEVNEDFEPDSGQD